MPHSLRAISPKQAFLIALSFLAVILIHLWGQERLGYLAVNSDQFYYKIFTAKALHPELYLNDPVYGDARNFQFYTPVFLSFIKPFFERWGFLPTLYLLHPFLAFAYLASCFVFLYKLTGKPWVSAFLAMVSGQSTAIFPVDMWGVYSIAQVMPRTCFLIFAPLLFYGWWRFQNEPKKLLIVFFVLGCLANLHPVSGLTLALPMLIAQVINQRFAWTSIKLAAACGLSALVPMLPFAFNYFGHTSEGVKVSGKDFKLLLEGLSYRIPGATPVAWKVYSSLILRELGWWLLGLWGAWQVRKQLPALIRWFVFSIILVFGIYYLVNFAFIVPRLGQLPSLIDLVRVTKFLMLPLLWVLVLWLAQSRGSLLWRKAALLIVLTAVLDGAAIYNALVQNPLKLGRSLERQVHQALAQNGFRIKASRLREIGYFQGVADISAWLQAHTPINSKIHVALPDGREAMMLRALSERSITFAGKDGGLLYYSNKPLFLTWYRQALLLEGLHQKQGYCSNEELWFARQQAATYILCPKEKALTLPTVYQNNDLTLYTIPMRSGRI